MGSIPSGGWHKLEIVGFHSNTARYFHVDPWIMKEEAGALRCLQLTLNFYLVFQRGIENISNKALAVNMHSVL